MGALEELVFHKTPDPLPSSPSISRLLLRIHHISLIDLRQIPEQRRMDAQRSRVVQLGLLVVHDGDVRERGDSDADHLT